MKPGFLATHEVLTLDTEHLASELLLDDGVSHCRKKVPLRTGTMIATRQVTVHQGEAMDGMLSYRHVDYERFLGFRRKVHRPDGGYTTRNLNIHNRFSMGAYYSIARELMCGLTSEVKAGLLTEFGQK